MLCRVALGVVCFFGLPVVASDDTGRALEGAYQNIDEMHRRTLEVFEQADGLAGSAEFDQFLPLDTVPAMGVKNALPSLPNLTPELLQRAREEIGALLDQAQQLPLATAPPAGQDIGPQLYIFVSFSMPEITLQRLLRQADRIGGTLVLRGFVEDDLGKTQQKIAQLLETDAFAQTQVDGGFAIDPTLFERFAIVQVPSFVLTETPVARCNDVNCPGTDYVRMAGDTTIEYVLKTMAREVPAMKQSAQRLLERLK